MAAASPTYNLQAQGNSARLEGAIPEHFGRMVAYPDHAAQPYQEFSGNDQYLYQLLCLGRGSYDVEAIRIEDTPLVNFDDVTWELVPPGGTVNLFPANVKTSIEVVGQDLPTGTYVGPFVANISGSTITTLGFDFSAPRGLYYANNDGSLAAMTASVQVETRLINDAGVAIGAWVVQTSGSAYSAWSDWTTVAASGTNTDIVEYSTLSWTGHEEHAFTSYSRRTRTVSTGVLSFTAASTTPQRYSVRYAVAAGRYEVRVKRTDTELTTTRHAHHLVWGGLRSYAPGSTSFGDVTLIALRMRANSSLSSQSSRKINVIATRKLPIWNGSSWSVPTATRSIAWALAYAAKQVGRTDAEIDLAALLTLDATWAARGDRFDGRFDNFLSFWEAATKLVGVGRAMPYMQGGILRVFRDQAVTIPVALYSMRNIVRGSFSVNYLMPTADTADAVDVGYFEASTWSPARVQAKLPGSTADRPVNSDLFGVTDRAQAFREGMYLAASNRYRRKMIKFSTEMEGFIPSFGDLIAIQHDMPAWGQGGDVTAWDSVGRIATLSEPLVWGVGTHYIGLRARDGSVAGPYVVTPGAASNQAVLATPPSFTPYTGGAEERTHFAFGWAETWRQLARVLSIKPSGHNRVALECINEDPSVHTAETGMIMPLIVTTQLSGYLNAPVMTTATAYPMRGNPTAMLLEWKAAPWAQSYVVEQSADEYSWTASGASRSTSCVVTLLYGKNSKFRVAAVGLSRGPWITVTPDTTPPADVESISYTLGKVDIKLSWHPIIDVALDSYELRVGPTSWETAVFVASVYGQEYAWAMQTAGVRKIWIKAVDTSLNYSTTAASVTTTITVPVAPTSFAYGFAGQDIALTWGIPTASFLLDGYQLRVGASWAAGVPQDTTKTPSYRTKADFVGTELWWVAAVDVAGNVGAATSVSVVISAPAAPPTFAYTLVGQDLVITWGIPTSSFAVDRYELRNGASWAAGTFVDTTKATGYRVKATFLGNQTWWIAAIDSLGNVGAAASVTLTINAPGVVLATRSEVVDNNALLYWSPPTVGAGQLPIDRYEVRKGATWAAGTTVGSNGNSTFGVVFEQASGNYIYWVAAVDVAGNFGTAVGIAATISQPPDYILRNNYDSPLTGTPLSTVTRSLTNLYAEGAQYLGPANLTETWATHFSAHAWATPAAQVAAGFPLYISPSLTAATYEEIIDYGTALPSTVITVTLNTTIITGAVPTALTISWKLALADAWTVLGAGVTSALLPPFRYARVQCAFTSTAGANLLALTGLNVKLSIKNRTDSGSGTAAVGGTLVNFGYPFLDADTPMVQPGGTTPRIPVVDFTDAPNPTGFIVKIYSTAGVDVGGPFSWTARGY
jgi:hypothetical protein